MGPGARFETDGRSSRFVVRSGQVGGSERGATVFIDARIPEPDLLRDRSALVQNTLKKGMIRPHVNSDAYPGRYYETGGMDVASSPYCIIDAEGRTNEDICASGTSTEFAHRVAAAGARLGGDSFATRDVDAVVADFARRLRDAEAATSTAGASGAATGEDR